MATNCDDRILTDEIFNTECIGNSLGRINSNFSNLDTTICDIKNTTDAINDISGIIKGHGDGTFTAAVHHVDYYVPGDPLYAALYVSGNITTSGNVVIGVNPGEYKDLTVTRGNVNCVNVNAVGTGNFPAGIRTANTLDVAGKGTFSAELQADTLTVNNTSLLKSNTTIRGTATLESTLTVGTSIRTPAINVQNSGGIIGNEYITVPIANVTTLNNTNAAILSAVITTAKITTLSAYGPEGIFIGTRVEATNGKINDTLSATNINADVVVTNRFTVKSLNAVQLNGNKIILTAGITDNIAYDGSIVAPIGNIDAFISKGITVTNIVNGLNTGAITCGTAVLSTLNASSTVNAPYVTGTEQVISPLGRFTTMRATAIEANTAAISNPSGTATLTVNGSNGNVGTISTNGTITANGAIQGASIEVKNSSNAYGAITANSILLKGTTNALIFESSGAELKLNGSSSTLHVNGSITGVGSITGASITAGAVSCTSVAVGNGAIGCGAITANGSITGASISTTGEITCSYLRSTGDIVAFAYSDKRLKRHITRISNALDKVSSLRGVDFEWDTDLQDVYQGKDTGIIAQEVEEIMPTAVTTRDTGYKAVKYDRLIPLLIEAVKELRDQNVLLKQEIEALKAK